jgi:hypothetical protein
MAKEFIRFKELDIARRRLEELIRVFPNTQAATEAKQLLHELEK